MDYVYSVSLALDVVLLTVIPVLWLQETPQWVLVRSSVKYKLICPNLLHTIVLPAAISGKTKLW